MCGVRVTRCNSGFPLAFASVITTLFLAASPALGQRNLTVAPAAPRLLEQRVALVIGNSGYGKSDALPQLRNPSNDARDIAAALRANGFSSVSLVLDADYRRMREAITQFGGELKNAGPNSVGLFYYAGHGVQDGGRNYLIPLGTSISNPMGLEYDTIDAQRVLAFMEEAGNRVNIVILDACRDNPFPVLTKFRSASAPSAGLAQMKGPAGSFIAFAAAEGQKASDGEGRNGLFTQQLLESLRQPDSSIDTVFTRVTAGVAEKTQRQQVPWRTSSLTSAFYFRPPPGGAQAAGAARPAAVVQVDPAAIELELWNSVKDSHSADELNAYLEQYPSGSFAAVARVRMRALGGATQIASAAPAIAATRPPVTAGSIAALSRGTAFRDCDGCPEMVVIPAGRFTMGSPASEPQRDSDEGPQHQVNIARPFAAGKYEVTFDEWDACVRDGGCSHNPGDEGWGRGRRPVINVSWQDAKIYTEWLSRKTGKIYRLLSEAQWEYVARAGTTTAFSFGAGINSQQANYNTSVSYAGSPVATTPRNTVPVGSYPANAFGLHDVHGNVWEWTEDCYNGSYSGAPSDGSAWTSVGCATRVLRGGSWDYYPRYLRSATRSLVDPTYRVSGFGFRVARTD
jgi:formylglycine-generating enzyme required for sulfatase activity